MKALQLNNVTKKYRASAEAALHNFSLEVNSGEIHAIVGESGCGKTTLLRLLAGLETPDEGEILLNEKIISGKSVYVQPEKRNIGFVFQEYALFPHLTVNQNVGFGLGNKISSEKNAEIKKQLELVGMNGFENRYPHELSGGQQQRVAIARSLATHPSVLLLDEPFSSLDEILKKQMRSQIKSIINNAGTTALFVTHDTNDALAIADKISVLKNGKLLQTATPETIYNQPVKEYVARMFGAANIVKGIYKSGVVTVNEIKIPVRESLVENSDCRLCIRPENIEISQSGTIKGRVKGTVFAGNKREVIIDVAGIEWQASTSATTVVETGKEIAFDIKRCCVIEMG